MVPQVVSNIYGDDQNISTWSYEVTENVIATNDDGETSEFSTVNTYESSSYISSITETYYGLVDSTTSYDALTLVLNANNSFDKGPAFRFAGGQEYTVNFNSGFYAWTAYSPIQNKTYQSSTGIASWGILSTYESGTSEQPTTSFSYQTTPSTTRPAMDWEYGTTFERTEYGVFYIPYTTYPNGAVGLAWPYDTTIATSSESTSSMSQGVNSTLLSAPDGGVLVISIVPYAYNYNSVNLNAALDGYNFGIDTIVPGYYVPSSVTAST